MPKVTGTTTVKEDDYLDIAEKVERMEWLFESLVPVPKEWLTHKRVAGKAGTTKNTEVEPLECANYDILVDAWRKTVKWTDGMDCALSCMLASIISTKFLGDQLWLKVLGPPSCGKTTLVEGLAANKKYVFSKSTISGFHSGYGGDPKQDNSLLKLVNDKTLATKDGDTLLKAPNLGKILAEARDIYDRVSRSQYLNKMGKDYEGLNMTWILCGTASLKSIDDSELGERFLDCVVMDEIDEDLEDEVGWMAANRADQDIEIESNGSVEGRYSPDRLQAHRLSSGYINYLRENAQDILRNIKNPDWAKRTCMKLGKFVAFMRARPSKSQEETSEREFSARLVSQHVRLSKCLAAVMNKQTIDNDVMQRVIKVALDTARGIGLEMVKKLHNHGEEGCSIHALEMYTGFTMSQVTRQLRFYKRVGAVESFTARWKVKKTGQIRTAPRWRLSRMMYRLYENVYEAYEG